MSTVLQDFAAENLGAIRILGEPHVVGGSTVLRLRDPAGHPWFAKQLVRPARWRAEVAAYRLWGGLDELPELRAACPRRRALLVAELPGRQPSGQSGRVLQRAGEVLRTLHDAGRPEDWADDWADRAAADAERRLRQLADAGIRVDAGLVRSHVADMVATALPGVATHGDYQPHNWRWRPGRLGVFDFAAAAIRPAAYDLGRLRYAACWFHPGLFARLLTGYGRPLTPEEQRFVVAMLPWRAVVGMSLGVRSDRPGMVEHGHLVLDAVARGRILAGNVSD